MSSINPETVVSVLKDQIENYDQKTEVKEEGRIIALGELSTSIIRLPSNTAAHAASGRSVNLNLGNGLYHLYGKIHSAKLSWFIVSDCTVII